MKKGANSIDGQRPLRFTNLPPWWKVAALCFIISCVIVPHIIAEAKQPDTKIIVAVVVGIVAIASVVGWMRPYVSRKDEAAMLRVRSHCFDLESSTALDHGRIEDDAAGIPDDVVAAFAGRGLALPDQGRLVARGDDAWEIEGGRNELRYRIGPSNSTGKRAVHVVPNGEDVPETEVFISYRNGADSDVAAALRGTLESRGIKVTPLRGGAECPHPVGSRRASDWIRVFLTMGVQSTAVLVVVAAEDVLESQWVRHEYEIGMASCSATLLLWSRGENPARRFVPFGLGASKWLGAHPVHMLDARDGVKSAAADVAGWILEARQWRERDRRWTRNIMVACFVVYATAFVFGPAMGLSRPLLAFGTAVSVGAVAWPEGRAPDGGDAYNLPPWTRLVRGGVFRGPGVIFGLLCAAGAFVLPTVQYQGTGHVQLLDDVVFAMIGALPVGVYVCSALGVAFHLTGVWRRALLRRTPL